MEFVKNDTLYQNKKLEKQNREDNFKVANRKNQKTDRHDNDKSGYCIPVAVDKTSETSVTKLVYVWIIL